MQQLSVEMVELKRQNDETVLEKVSLGRLKVLIDDYEGGEAERGGGCRQCSICAEPKQLIVVTAES